MLNTKAVDLVVVGGGPAGMAAAVAAAEAGVEEIVLLERQAKLGGILPQCIHNGFGLRYFKEELTGPEYAYRFMLELKKKPRIQVKTETMVVTITPDRQVVTTSAAEGLVCYQARAVILAMGCRERPRGAINIPGTRPAGIYTAGSLQYLLNIEGFLPGRTAVILGSGDIGLIMARRLTLEGIRVRAVLELMPYSNGLNRNVVQCLEDFNIPLYLSHTVTAIHGQGRVEKVSVAPVDADLQPLVEKGFDLACDTLVLSVGLIPENELSLQAGVELDPATGGPVVDSFYQTTVEGIFACGNVAHVHDVVDDVSAESAIAGRAAAAYLRGEIGGNRWLPVKAGRNIRSVVPQRIVVGQATPLYIRARFPEKNAQLNVGHGHSKRRIVSPGETIYYTVKPEDICSQEGFVRVGLEGGKVDD
ncbi:MAG TPA: FAD-dependent oxidoreductase [Firmicutes bacterium]|jgi:NADPH-dependent 2,4-dienoyl-CoA reductase/sulfur reductase-like enzyme|nr:FAD-dependent oxidoreductase [Bacillota bacterium]